jgi:Arc/MetJ-type ribon-helix-helix transcriptional regulator
MQIELTAEQQEIIRRAIDHGRLRQPEDAIREALELWIER